MSPAHRKSWGFGYLSPGDVLAMPTAEESEKKEHSLLKEVPGDAPETSWRGPPHKNIIVPKEREAQLLILACGEIAVAHKVKVRSAF